MMRNRMKFKQISMGKAQDSSVSSDHGGKKKDKSWDKSNGRRCYRCGKFEHF